QYSHLDLLEEGQALKCRELLEAWPSLNHKDRLERIESSERYILEDLILHLPPEYRGELLFNVKPYQRWALIRLMAPDDCADLIQLVPEELREEIFLSLDDSTRTEVKALLAYNEDQAGGRMNSRYARLRPNMTVEEAISYLRALSRHQAESIYQAYVVGPENELLGAVSLRQLFASPSKTTLEDIMAKGDTLVKIPENMDQEEIGRLFKKKSFTVLPVVDTKNRIIGIVTVDDFVKVIQEEATEDIQKLGGMESLDAPYFSTPFNQLIKKRAGWLLALFVGEMFTATAMGHFEGEISKAVVLALFIPLIISSGGNSGSQATTLIIRAMALGEVKLKDWWRVFFREAAAGLLLGVILGGVGLCRILLWPARKSLYGEHYTLIGITVALSLVGIVLWGALVGSMLPFLFRRLKLDPAAASAPFVATMVDVTGLIIYFSVASIILSGTLL
ncbi:MAG: magnesium transporter, partial [Bacteriovoracales bacterium]